ncbi:Atp-dependent clp protease atp-binding protein, partial [Haematococcus lacustris]
MLAQQHAKTLGATEVGAEHLLLGLIAEEAGSKGYLGT